MLAEERTACKVAEAPDECVADPKPHCTPFRSVDHCSKDESFQTYIQSRTSYAKANADEVQKEKYWFREIEDKMSSYKLSASLGLNPPKIYECSTDVSTLSEFVVPKGVAGFVIRATDLHSNSGIYVLPSGFGGLELIRDVEMGASDIESDLLKMNVKKFVIEEYVGSETALPMEFKFHMFNGKVGSINVVANRGGNCACEYVILLFPYIESTLRTQH